MELEPVELASSYDLQTVEGDVPPRLIGATVECDVSVEGGRLSFGPAEQFELGLDVLALAVMVYIRLTLRLHARRGAAV